MLFSIVPKENFPNEFMAFLFSIIFILFLLIELKILIKQRLSSKEDKGSLLVILISIIISFSVLFYLAYNTQFGRLPFYFSYIGLIFVLIGFFIRQYSISILGKYFTPTIKVGKGQKIVKKGMYNYIRHPFYTGLILEICGVGLFLSNWFSFLISFILIFYSLSYRIKIEEKILIKEFGSEYINYIKNTKKLIPFLY